MKSAYIKLFSISLILCLGIIVYSNTFYCSFHFDDNPSIVDNFAIKNIQNLQDIWDFWPSRFITYLSIAFNYHINGLDVFGYHLFNLGIHIVSAILVWWLTLLTFFTPAMKEVVAEKNVIGKKPTHKSKKNLPILKQVPSGLINKHAHLIALFAGLVFVSHPIQTQAVTYIVQRAASMATLFYVATLCFYIKSRLLEDNKSGVAFSKFYYICSLITAVMAMFTKEMTVTLPFMILLYEFTFFKTKKNFNWGHVIPFLVTLFIIPLTMWITKSVNFHEMHRVAEGATKTSSIQYLLTQLRVMITYIRLLFLPLNQNLDYDYHVYSSLFELPVLISFLFLIVVLYVAKRLFLRYPLLSFSIFWFFLTLLPESSFIPIEDVICEHRLYLPLVGYSIFLVSGVYYLFGKKTITTMVVALTMLIACNSVLTYQRNKVWKDEFTLWNDTVGKSPHKARPYSNRGKYYLAQNNFTQAISDFTQAIAISPNLALAYTNRGAAYEGLGELTQAMSDLNKAIEINPNLTEAYCDRGIVYDKKGDFNKAISDYTRAIELNPNNADAYNDRGNAYSQQGHLTEAMSDYAKAIALNPKYNYAQAYTNRGKIYFDQGNFSQAMFDFNQSIQADPKDALSYYDRGVIYGKQGNLSQAAADYTKAIELNPKYVEAYINRGGVFFQQSDFFQAMSDFNKAIELGSNYAEVYNNRGLTNVQLGNITQAISDYTKAIELKPDYTVVYKNRALIYYKLHNFTQAISDFSKAIEINPNDEDAYNNRAVSYYKLGQYSNAWADVHKAQGLGDSINPQFINLLEQASGQSN